MTDCSTPQDGRMPCWEPKLLVHASGYTPETPDLALVKRYDAGCRVEGRRHNNTPNQAAAMMTRHGAWAVTSAPIRALNIVSGNMPMKRRCYDTLAIDIGGNVARRLALRRWQTTRSSRTPTPASHQTPEALRDAYPSFSVSSRAAGCHRFSTGIAGDGKPTGA